MNSPMTATTTAGQNACAIAHPPTFAPPLLATVRRYGHLRTAMSDLHRTSECGSPTGSAGCARGEIGTYSISDLGPSSPAVHNDRRLQAPVRQRVDRAG